MKRSLILFATLALGVVIGSTAAAGYAEDNIYLSLHRNPGDLEAVYELRLHRGSQSIDTVSPEFDKADFYQLKATAMMGQADFDATASAVLGSWYSNLSGARRAEFRATFIDAC